MVECEKPQLNVISWSGGKDSTATIILAKKLNIPIDKIIISLPMFDRSRNIYADNPKHVEWILHYAKPLIESWGYPIDVVTGEHDYMYWFHHTITKSKVPERNGKIAGFLIPGKCYMNREKVNPINKPLKELKKRFSLTMFEGIAADETDRLLGMKQNRKSRSILAENGIVENDTYGICQPFGLLSPIYSNGRKRQGCWFCPNQSIAEHAELKMDYPEYYRELELLSKIKDIATRNFSYGKSFDQVDFEVNEYIVKNCMKGKMIYETYI